jgi:hypothetical protein
MATVAVLLLLLLQWGRPAYAAFPRGGGQNASASRALAVDDAVLELAVDAAGGALAVDDAVLELAVDAAGGALAADDVVLELAVDAAGGTQEVGHRRRSLQSGGAGTLTLNIPPAGSLSPIFGRLQLPPGTGTTPDQYKLCVYLLATGLFNGPKPAEDEGSFSPIAPDGTYNFVDWWANALFDPVSPFIMGYAFPIALGDCLPVLGLPNFPLLMDTLSIAYTRLPRVVTLGLSLAQGWPALNASQGAFSLTITGMPPNPIAYKVLLYFSRDGGATVTGPAPACTAAASFLPNAQAQLIIPLDAALQGIATLHFVLVAAAVEITATPRFFLHEVVVPVVCGEDMAPMAGAVLPQALAGLQLALLTLTRLPPPPTPSASSTPSPTPTPTPTPLPTATCTPTPTPFPLAALDAEDSSVLEVSSAPSAAASALGSLLWGGLVLACHSIVTAFTSL